MLELRDVNGTLIASNDSWKSAQQAQIQATGLAPGDDRDAAILATLQPGNYTAIVRGSGGTTGIALVGSFRAAAVASHHWIPSDHFHGLIVSNQTAIDG